MAHAKSDLFKWKRRTNALDVARGGNKSTMKEWIKKVHDASERAAIEAFGSNVLASDPLKEIVPDDAALYEAQELIDNWLQEKEFPDLDRELQFKNESWSKNNSQMLYAGHQHNAQGSDALTEFRSKYLYGDDDDEGKEGMHTADDLKFNLSSRNTQEEYSNCYSKIKTDFTDEDIDDTLLVQDVLNNMMQKELVKKVDLGMKPLERKVRDPTLKMNQRHLQVKAKSQQMRQKEANLRQEKLKQKEIEEKAKKKVVLEEKERSLRQKSEERAIQLEMAKIRKQLQEEKHLRIGEEERKQNVLLEAKKQMQEKLRQQKNKHLEEETRRKQAEKEMRLYIQKEAEVKSLKELKWKMKILHKHFSAWYDVILRQRLNLGKATAISDWKCKLKAWNAWKAYVSCVKSNQEARAVEEAMKEKYRKEQMSVKHHNKKLQRICFMSWLKYARYKQEKKLLVLERESKAKKMALFLEVASKGLLAENQKILKGLKPTASPHLGINKKISDIAEQKADKLKEDLRPSKHQEDTLDVKPLNHKRKSVLEYRENTENTKSEVQIGPIGNVKVPDLRSANLESKASVPHGPKDVVSGVSAKEDLISQRSESSSVVSTSRKPVCKSDRPTTKPLRLAMEQRNEERRERKVQIQEQKRKREEEKLRELQKRELERKQKEEQEKEEILKQKREERRIKAQKEKEKELRLEQMHIQNNMAIAHYNNFLLKKYGMEPLQRLVKIKEINIQISNKYHHGKLLKITFRSWYEWSQEAVLKKLDAADNCYCKILLKRSFHLWQKLRFNLHHLNQAAKKHNSRRILKRAFHGWQDHVTDERILMWAKESQAEEHNERRLLKGSLYTWRCFVQNEKDERVKEVRRNELRKKVQSWLPDFKGNAQS